MAIQIPAAGKTAVIIAALYCTKNFLPVHVIILCFFLALADQFFQNRLSVLDGSGEHLLSILLYRFEVKFIVI